MLSLIDRTCYLYFKLGGRLNCINKPQVMLMNIVSCKKFVRPKRVSVVPIWYGLLVKKKKRCRKR